MTSEMLINHIPYILKVLSKSSNSLSNNIQHAKRTNFPIKYIIYGNLSRKLIVFHNFLKFEDGVNILWEFFE